MLKHFFLSFVLLTGLMLIFQTVSAQITVNIPNIPKIPKIPKPPKGTGSTGTNDSQNKSTNNTGGQSGNNQSQSNDGSTSQGKQGKEPMLLSFYMGDIKKAQDMVDNFTPGCCIYFVDAARSEWLLKAVSPRAFQAWMPKDKEFADWNTAHPGNQVEQALKALADSASKKLPTYQPDPKKLAFHNAAEEKMMQSKLPNPSTTKIFKIGLTHGSWQIETNSLGIPTDRYKWGVIWARDSSDDHPYCHIYHINIIQDYSGGGTYGAAYARFISDELAGCESGK